MNEMSEWRGTRDQLGGQNGTALQHFREGQCLATPSLEFDAAHSHFGHSVNHLKATGQSHFVMMVPPVLSKKRFICPQAARSRQRQVSHSLNIVYQTAGTKILNAPHGRHGRNSACSYPQRGTIETTAEHVHGRMRDVDIRFSDVRDRAVVSGMTVVVAGVKTLLLGWSVQMS